MRIMALDVGSKRIGVALSDPLKITAQGLETFQRKTLEEDVKGLWKLIDEHEVSQLVVGLPKNMDGTEGERARVIRAFADLVREYTAIEIDFFDERMSTMVAYRFLGETGTYGKKRKDTVDTLSAQIILQNYLDSRR